MFLAVDDLSDGVLLGQVGIAGFILDHRAGELLRRAGRRSPAVGGEKKADDKINDVGKKNKKDKPEKTLNHGLNVPDFRACVKPSLAAQNSR